MEKYVAVVEDDNDIAEVIKIILVDAGFNVTISSNACAFRDLLAHFPRPDLILLDIMLPDGNGIELCHYIKQQPNMLDIPLILMSAHTGQAEALLNSSADDFIAKPFDIYEFITKIESLIPHHS